VKLKILPFLLGGVLMVNSADAAPLTDYSPGKTAIDVTWRHDLDLDDYWKGYVYPAEGKDSNLDWGVTTGLGNKFALQYRQFNPKGEGDYTDLEEGKYHLFEVKLKSHEANLLFQLDKHFSSFIGWHRSKLTWLDNGERSVSQKKGQLQIGIIGVADLGNKTKLYGNVGFAPDLQNFEAGISYELTGDIDLNLSYRYLKVNEIKLFTVPEDFRAKGWGLGFTYKF